MLASTLIALDARNLAQRCGESRPLDARCTGPIGLKSVLKALTGEIGKQETWMFLLILLYFNIV